MLEARSDQNNECVCHTCHCHHWFKSFLTNRKQFVSVSGSNSSSKKMPFGVPQGSVLGPLLFILYVNDLHSAILFSIVNLFADDTMLIFYIVISKISDQT